METLRSFPNQGTLRLHNDDDDDDDDNDDDDDDDNDNTQQLNKLEAVTLPSWSL